MNGTAVLLMNYGGPEKAEDCEAYIRNIFLDPDLIPIPSLIRPLVARLAGRRRGPVLQKNYEAMGQFSPILAQTNAQAKALEAALGEGFTCFTGMRYWAPFIDEICCVLRPGGFTRVVLLPLYPQESRSTTGSSINEARRCLEDLRFGGEIVEIRSFWDEAGYLEALTERVKEALDASPAGARVLFSAHGLPLSVAKRDPYPGHVALTVRAVASRLGLALDPMEIPSGRVEGEPVGRDQGAGSGEREGAEPSSGSSAFGPRFSAGGRPPATGAPTPHSSRLTPHSSLLTPHSSLLTPHSHPRASLAWQSKVGPAKWLEPSVEQTLHQWAKEGVKDIVLVPVAFVSEHSETLYELDVLYGGMARELGMAVRRVPTVQTDPRFIQALASKIKRACDAAGANGD